MWRVAAACLAVTAAQKPIPHVPVSGAAFTERSGVPAAISKVEDRIDSNAVRALTKPNYPNSDPPNTCIDGPAADKAKCLSHTRRECMFVKIEGTAPVGPDGRLKMVQPVEMHCMPCQIDEQPIPCWNQYAIVGGMRVLECEMQCPHQLKVREPEYTCSDESGFITTPQCFDLGAKSGSKCMHLKYKQADGTIKTSCAPCFVSGTGGWGCPANGEAGPWEGSTVAGCVSQCDSICPGPPNCPPTIVPPPPLPNPAPGVAKTALKDQKELLIAPAPFAMPTLNPYSIAQAAADQAKKLGWVVGTPPPPQGYFPVVMYRSPLDYMATPMPVPQPFANVRPPVPTGFLQRSERRRQLLKSARARTRADSESEEVAAGDASRP